MLLRWLLLCAGAVCVTGVGDFPLHLNSSRLVSLIKPWSDGVGQRFGSAVDVASVGLFAVSSPGERIVYIFSRDPGEWGLYARVKPPTTHTVLPDYGFGESIVFRDQQLIVSSPRDAYEGTGINPSIGQTSCWGCGAVYIYESTIEKPNAFKLIAYLKPPRPQSTGYQFGASIAASPDGSVVAVGAPYNPYGTPGVHSFPAYLNDRYTLPQSGAVFVYSRGGAYWGGGSYRPLVVVRRPDADVDGPHCRCCDLFGSSVAVTTSTGEMTLAVGAPGSDGLCDKCRDSGDVSLYHIHLSRAAPLLALPPSSTGGGSAVGTPSTASPSSPSPRPSPNPSPSPNNNNNNNNNNRPSGASRDSAALKSAASSTCEYFGTLWPWWPGSEAASFPSAGVRFGESLSGGDFGNTAYFAVGSTHDQSCGSGVVEKTNATGVCSETGAVWVFKDIGVDAPLTVTPLPGSTTGGTTHWPPSPAPSPMMLGTLTPLSLQPTAVLRFRRVALLKSHLPTEHQTSSRFGGSVSLRGSGERGWVAVGAPLLNGKTGVPGGAVYLYSGDSRGKWSTEDAYGALPNRLNRTEVGHAVAVIGSGDGFLAVVGAPMDSREGEGVNPRTDDWGFEESSRSAEKDGVSTLESGGPAVGRGCVYVYHSPLSPTLTPTDDSSFWPSSGSASSGSLFWLLLLVCCSVVIAVATVAVRKRAPKLSFKWKGINTKDKTSPPRFDSGVHDMFYEPEGPGVGGGGDFGPDFSEWP